MKVADPVESADTKYNATTMSFRKGLPGIYGRPLYGECVALLVPVVTAVCRLDSSISSSATARLAFRTALSIFLV